MEEDLMFLSTAILSRTRLPCCTVRPRNGHHSSGSDLAALAL